MNNNKEEVAETLMCLANIDNDFHGENGAEYLWEEAELGGFESNAEYCLWMAQREETPRAIIEKFISLWMGRDYYYQDYDLGILVDGDKLFLSLAYMTE
jgi:hypothetical protein